MRNNYNLQILILLVIKQIVANIMVIDDLGINKKLGDPNGLLMFQNILNAKTNGQVKVVPGKINTNEMKPTQKNLSTGTNNFQNNIQIPNSNKKNDGADNEKNVTTINYSNPFDSLKVDNNKISNSPNMNFTIPSNLYSPYISTKPTPNLLNEINSTTYLGNLGNDNNPYLRYSNKQPNNSNDPVNQNFNDHANPYTSNSLVNPYTSNNLVNPYNSKSPVNPYSSNNPVNTYNSNSPNNPNNLNNSNNTISPISPYNFKDSSNPDTSNDVLNKNNLYENTDRSSESDNLNNLKKKNKRNKKKKPANNNSSLKHKTKPSRSKSNKKAHRDNDSDNETTDFENDSSFIYSDSFDEVLNDYHSEKHGKKRKKNHLNELKKNGKNRSNQKKNKAHHKDLESTLSDSSTEDSDYTKKKHYNPKNSKNDKKTRNKSNEYVNNQSDSVSDQNNDKKTRNKPNEDVNNQSDSISDQNNDKNKSNNDKLSKPKPVDKDTNEPSDYENANKYPINKEKRSNNANETSDNDNAKNSPINIDKPIKEKSQIDIGSPILPISTAMVDFEIPLYGSEKKSDTMPPEKQHNQLEEYVKEHQKNIHDANDARKAFLKAKIDNMKDDSEKNNRKLKDLKKMYDDTKRKLKNLENEFIKVKHGVSAEKSVITNEASNIETLKNGILNNDAKIRMEEVELLKLSQMMNEEKNKLSMLEDKGRMLKERLENIKKEKQNNFGHLKLEENKMKMYCMLISGLEKEINSIKESISSVEAIRDSQLEMMNKLKMEMEDYDNNSNIPMFIKYI